VPESFVFETFKNNIRKRRTYNDKQNPLLKVRERERGREREREILTKKGEILDS
jgi:hypothetical protein